MEQTSREVKSKKKKLHCLSSKKHVWKSRGSVVSERRPNVHLKHGVNSYFLKSKKYSFIMSLSMTYLFMAHRRTLPVPLLESLFYLFFVYLLFSFFIFSHIYSIFFLKSRNKYRFKFQLSEKSLCMKSYDD